METESVQYLLNAARQALESRGAMGSLRSHLQAELFGALEEKVRAADGMPCKGCTTGARIEHYALLCCDPLRCVCFGAAQPPNRPVPPFEARLINELICEYLSFNHYNYTLSVFMSEADLRSNSRLTRAAAYSALGLATPRCDDAV